MLNALRTWKPTFLHDKSFYRYLMCFSLGHLRPEGKKIRSTRDTPDWDLPCRTARFLLSSKVQGLTDREDQQALRLMRVARDHSSLLSFTKRAYRAQWPSLEVTDR